MGTDPRRKSECTAFIAHIMGKILKLHEKGLLQEKKNLQNRHLVGLEPFVSLEESILTTGLVQICYTYVFVII